MEDRWDLGRKSVCKKGNPVDEEYMGKGTAAPEGSEGRHGLRVHGVGVDVGPWDQSSTG